MSAPLIYALTGIVIAGLGLFHYLSQRNILRKVLAGNFIGTGVFLFMVSSAARQAPGPIDPIPHALVLTGIVVAVSATALLLALVCRYHDETGSLTLDEEDDE
jgi:multicomponent Na+:H+ antiporter subunit C